MSNLFEALKVEYPHDIAVIRSAHPILSRLSDLEVERLWDRFSDSYAAGWLIVTEETMDQFRSWLRR